MEIPEGAKFMFIAIPVILVASILILVYMGKANTKAQNNLSEKNMLDISNGKSLDSLSDFEELKVETTKEGKGPGAGVGDSVVVNYELSLMDGSVLQTTFGSENPFEFQLGVGQVIKGWDEGVKDMKVGEERMLYIPSSMGYGDDGIPGSIPGKAGLVFKVELLEIK
jgi:peptidylprolyl isomerase